MNQEILFCLRLTYFPLIKASMIYVKEKNNNLNTKIKDTFYLFFKVKRVLTKMPIPFNETVENSQFPKPLETHTNDNDRGQGSYCGFALVKGLGLGILSSPFETSPPPPTHPFCQCHWLFVGSLRKVSRH